jgi:Do/DeqQ family serine protease
MQHIGRIGHGTAAVLALLVLPAQCRTGATAAPRQNHAQRTGRKQTAHATTIANRTWRRFARCLRLNKNDFLQLVHGLAELYLSRHLQANRPRAPRDCGPAYNLPLRLELTSLPGALHPKIDMKRLWLLFSQVVTVVLATYFVVGTLKPGWLNARLSGGASVALLEAPATNPGVIPPGSFRLAAQKSSAAVVSINTSKASKLNPHGNDPWFKFFFGEQGGEPQVGLGSGVIVSASGYVLTNNHVVEGADEIEVILNDSRHAQAKVIGTDPDADLAVLKIELDRLPVIVLGNSDSLQVGDQVLAIGNPFGVGQTVTGGIVSAMGRNHLGINTFENFIQTDAAINPGNSGGALVDTNGNLLGINTAIYSRSGGSMGIGFAIPVSTAKLVLEGIVKDGQVTRGWIGVEPNDLSPELAETFGVKVSTGVIITGVLQNGPAAQAGIRPGDVITQVADRPVNSVAELLSSVAALKPGTASKFVLLRREEKLTLDVTPGVRPKPRKQTQ